MCFTSRVAMENYVHEDYLQNEGVYNWNYITIRVVVVVRCVKVTEYCGGGVTIR